MHCPEFDNNFDPDKVTSPRLRAVLGLPLRMVKDMNEDNVKTRKGYIQFMVEGTAKPSGSKVSFPHPTTGKKVYLDMCKSSKKWKAEVAKAAKAAGVKKLPKGTPVRLDIAFFMPRPKAHYGTGKNSNVLKSWAPEFHTSKPDRTKLLRCAEDALKGIAWDDDSQVVDGYAVKRYDGMPPGALIEISIAE